MREKDDLLDYIREVFAPEDDVLRDAKARLAAHEEKLVGIQVGAEEGKLLQFLIKLAGVKSIVEIGSLAGYSAVWMARGLPEDGIVHAINKDPQHYELLKETTASYNHSPLAGESNPDKDLVGGKSESSQRPPTESANASSTPPQGGSIKCWLGDARDVLKTLEADAPFDMVFIDADKGGYVEYLDWAEKHVRKGGLIIGDNTLLFGHVNKTEKPEGTSQKAWAGMREFNERLADSTCYDAILIPTLEGLTVARKRF